MINCQGRVERNLQSFGADLLSARATSGTMDKAIATAAAEFPDGRPLEFNEFDNVIRNKLQIKDAPCLSLYAAQVDSSVTTRFRAFAWPLLLLPHDDQG